MGESELLIGAAVSEREAEVLALVGEHLTNQEIARRLVISVRTVESHVSSLLRKLEVADRRALAELAMSLAEETGGDAGPAAVVAESAAPIRYTKSDDLNIAYQVTGAGDVDLVLVAGFVSHLMLDWTERRHAHFLRRLGTFSRLIRFDKRGTGMSDRPEGLPDLETRMGDVMAVMDAARAERAVLFGYSEGGPMSILYAASHPERVHGLVIYSSYARRMRAPDYPWGFLPEERAHYAAQLEQEWAFEADMHRMCPHADEELARWWGERCRAATSPGAARALVEMASLIDVRDALGAVQAPTLVLHRRDDIDAHVDEGRYIAERIPGAQFVELDGHRSFRRGRSGPDPRPGGGLRSRLGILRSARDLAHHAPRDPPRGAHRPGLGARHPARSARGVPRGGGRRRRRDGAGHVRWPRAGGAVRPRADRAGRGRQPPPLGRAAHRRDRAAGRACLRRRRRRRPEGADRAPMGEVWATSSVRDLTADSALSFEPREHLDVPPLGRQVQLVAATDHERRHG